LLIFQKLTTKIKLIVTSPKLHLYFFTHLLKQVINSLVEVFQCRHWPGPRVRSRPLPRSPIPFINTLYNWTSLTNTRTYIQTYTRCTPICTHQRSYSTSGPVSTWMGDRLCRCGWIDHLRTEQKERRGRERSGGERGLNRCCMGHQWALCWLRLSASASFPTFTTWQWTPNIVSRCVLQKPL